MNAKDYLDGLWGAHEENGEHRPDSPADLPEIAPNDEWRQKRLTTAWGHANALVGGMSHKYKRLWAGAILRLDDRKGTIQIVWRDDLSRVMFEGVILGGWEAAGDHAHHNFLAA